MKKTLWLLFIAFATVACNKKQAIETEQISLYKSYCLTEACHDSIQLQFEIEFPKVLDNQKALYSIQQNLIDKFFGHEYVGQSIEDALDSYVSFSYTEYIANNKAFAERLETDENEDGAILSEQQVLTARVISDADGILTYEVEQYVYMGGAHGINTRIYYNYEMESGILLTEKDVFVAGFEQPVTQLMHQMLIEQSEEFSSFNDFLDAGFEFDNIRPNGNFAITHDAIIYIFNPYEIAPYAYGETEIVLTKELLANWLKK